MRCAPRAPRSAAFLVLLTICTCTLRASAQQSYAGLGSDCSSAPVSNSPGDVNVGYSCSAAQSTCQTYAYYRAQQSQTLSDVAALFDSDAADLAAASSLSSSASLKANQPLFIPVSCDCSGSLDYSTMNVSYTIQPGDTFFKIANATYQSLSTCNGIETFNPSVTANSLVIGASLTVPLRCACPSQAQLDQGIKLLITYPIGSGDSVGTISSGFGASLSAVQSANELSQTSVLYAESTILIPLTEKPATPPSLGGSNGTPPTSSPSGSSSSKAVTIAIAVSVSALVVIVLVIVGVFCYCKRRKGRDDPNFPKTSSEVALMDVSNTKSSSFVKQHEIDIDGINYKLPSYTKQEILAATNNFDASNLIKGSLYRGLLKDQAVAIKRVDGNASNKVSLFRSLHHANLVPLIGACLGTQESFLVYPYIGEGSLKDWLHEFPYDDDRNPPSSLTWFARVRIATDVANALEYLHEYTNPGYIHKNITSSNILVDEKFRGKLSNLGLAKSKEDMKEGIALTRHIEGKQGYLAPEYMNEGILSSKTDVFAFGIVLLEMLSGKEPILMDQEGMPRPGKSAFLWESINSVMQADDMATQENLKQWVDPVLKGRFPLPCALKMLKLARACVSEDSRMRPGVTYITSVLNDILEDSQKWEAKNANNGDAREVTS